MYNFILQTVVLVSLGVIIYLIARTAPRVTEIDTLPFQEGYFDKFMKKLPLERADAIVSAIFEKTLRKFKIIILKLDNLLGEHLKNLRSSNNPQQTIFDKVKEEKEKENTE